MNKQETQNDDDKKCVFSYDEQVTLLEILNQKIAETQITAFKKYLQEIRKKIGA